MAHEHPKEPACEHESRMVLTSLCVVARWRHLKVPRGPPEAMTMTDYVVLVAGLVGFHPSKRQPLPGTQILWKGVLILNNYIHAYEALLADPDRLEDLGHR